MFEHVTKWVVITVCLAFLAGCSLPRGAALQSEILRESDADTPSFAVVPVTRAAIPQISSWPATGWHGHYHWIEHQRGPSSQVIQSGDLINLTIWDSQENSLLTGAAQKSVDMRGLQVSASGTIFVPYVDEVVVRGLTPDRARSRIQSKLEQIAPSAQVQLTATQGHRNSIDLVGGVGKPGPIALSSRDMTILSAIAQGGGVAASLKYPVVRLIRGGETYTIPASTLYADARKNTTLRGNDKIVVEEDKRIFTALGATGIENIINFNKEHITAMEALSLIGGISDTRANPEGVLILREYAPSQVRPGKGPEMTQVIFTIDLTNADGLFAARNFQINPNDTVLATESPVTAARTILGLFGNALGLSTQVAAASGG